MTAARMYRIALRLLSFISIGFVGCVWTPSARTPAQPHARPGFAWATIDMPGWRVYLDTADATPRVRTRVAGLLDSSRASVTRALGLAETRDTVSVFLVPSRARMRDLVGRESNGTAFPNTNTLVLVLFPSGWIGAQHELLHLMAMRAWGVPERWLNEGLAVSLEGQWHGYPLHALAHHLQTSGRLPTARALTDRFDQLDDLITYPAAGSFVEFLLEAYGRESLRRLWRREGDWTGIYGKSLAALEAEWMAVVRAAPISGISYPPP